MDMWLLKPAMKSSNKKLVGSSKDKNCQATIIYKKHKKYEYDDFQMCSDKDCQENINMWSVTNKDDMQLFKPAIRRLCCDKNCQSTRCYKKSIYDKN